MLPQRGTRTIGRPSLSGRYLAALLYSLLLAGAAAGAGNPLPDSLWIDVSQIRFSMSIPNNCYLTSAPREILSPEQVTTLPFSRISISQVHPIVPMKLMDETSFIEFGLYNNTKDTLSFYFTPGYYFRNLIVYRARPENPEGSVVALPDSNRSSLYRGAFLLSINPGERSLFYVSLNFIRTNTNNLFPYLIEKNFLKEWVKGVKHRDSILDTITYVISGILLMMIFYSVAVYLQNRNREFAYYSVYAFCCAVLVFYKSFLFTDNTAFNFFYEEYLDFMILGLGVYFYLIFMRKFLNTSQDHPFLDKLLKLSDWILISLLGIFSIIYFLSSQYLSLYVLENYIIKIFLFVIGIAFVIYSIRKKDKLLNYLAAGNFALIFFSILSLLVVLGVRFLPTQRGSIWNKGMFYYELGLVFELLFFLSGLAYKNRHDLIERVKERERLKLENERKEFEKQVAVLSAKQEERDRISTDMHDELGSGMTAIRLMSEIVKTKMKNEPFPELERISSSANDLLGKMNTIIWTMKSSNDSLESLVAYLREHSLEYFENTTVDCLVEVPEQVPQAEMSGEKRRNIFLSVKESLHNVLKHAHATKVRILISITDHRLIIRVQDNGVGIDTEKLRRFGNGLGNMKRRMESIKGEFSVESNGGCTISFIAPL